MGRTSRERVARNFIKRYGASELEWLLDALANGESGQNIADRFSVSRERVRQWKNTFGQVVTLYQVHTEVQNLLTIATEPEPEPMSIGGAGVFLVED
ncbi:MAG: hypothetical protein R3F61_03385 [Myxococcota bacterium]